MILFYNHARIRICLIKADIIFGNKNFPFSKAASNSMAFKRNPFGITHHQPPFKAA
jgi:hypothetical protein